MDRMWRLLLPGLAFQAVLIGGGYATGRELVSFYLSSGPLGGLLSMGVTAVIWSFTMMVVLEIARRYNIHDYRSFFQKLIGPGWIAFEVAYIALLIVVLSIVGAAAGEIIADIAGLPKIVGTTALVTISTIVLLLGGEAVKRVLSYWSVFLYVSYIAFFILFVSKLGDLSLTALKIEPLGKDIFLNGLKYAGVNINCFASILFLVTTLKTRKEAFISGALVGPIAMIPGILFFYTIIGFYPQISEETVPLNFILSELEAPTFKVIFQIAILGTLLQTGVGMLHAVNERVSVAYEQNNNTIPNWLRALIPLTLMVFSITVAEWIGLVSLIDNGYGFLSWVFIILIFIPVFTIGLRIIMRKNINTQGDTP